MCTFLLYHDPDSPQPLTMASTRDEALSRRTKFPSQVKWDKKETYDYYINRENARLHLNFCDEEHPETKYQKYIDAGIQGPQDEEIGGMFAGINKHGLVVAVNNLEFSADVRNKLARGGLVLDALTFNSALDAAVEIYKKLREIQKSGITTKESDFPSKYTAFNLIIADKNAAYMVQCGPKSLIPELHDKHPSEPKGFSVPDMEGSRKRGLLIPDRAHEDNDTIVSVERLPSRRPIIICGWGPNDQRSQRTQKLLKDFTQLVDSEANLPVGKDKTIASWMGWLRFMQDRSQGIGNAYGNSIAQPPYTIYSKIPGDPSTIQWGTVSTSLFSIKSKDGEARMYFSPSMPTVEKPMEFQRVRSLDLPDRTRRDPTKGPKNWCLIPAHDESNPHPEILDIDHLPRRDVRLPGEPFTLERFKKKPGDNTGPAEGSISPG